MDCFTTNSKIDSTSTAPSHRCFLLVVYNPLELGQEPITANISRRKRKAKRANASRLAHAFGVHAIFSSSTWSENRHVPYAAREPNRPQVFSCSCCSLLGPRLIHSWYWLRLSLTTHAFIAHTGSKILRRHHGCPPGFEEHSRRRYVTLPFCIHLALQSLPHGSFPANSSRQMLAYEPMLKSNCLRRPTRTL